MMSQQQACDSPPGELEMQISSKQVHLYFSWPEQISDQSLLGRYESLLSADERTRMSRFHFARNRHSYLVTRALIRTSLSAYYPVDPETWRFGTNRYGKPEISHPYASLPVRFNLSHTDGLIVCAITRDHAIGVDVEDLHRSTQSGLSNLSSYFSKREAADLCALPTEQQKHRFFDYWTLKESYIKARGEGLAIPLGGFSFHFEADKLKKFTVEPDLLDRAECWQFWRMALVDQHGFDQGGADRYRIALAVKSSAGKFTVTAVRSTPLRNHVPVPLRFL